MVSKVAGALAAFAAAIAAGFLAFFSLRRLQREAVAEEVDGLRKAANAKNKETIDRLKAEATEVRASVEAVGDDRAKLAALLDE